MRRFLLPFIAGLAAVLLGPAASANELIAEVQARLQDSAVLRGKFEQHKSVAGFRQPLRSSGDFVLSRGLGLLWETRQPFAATLVLTGKRLSSQQGSASLSLDSVQEPALAATNQLLFAMLSGDVGKLSDSFAVAGELDGQTDWQLRLTPQEPGMARVFKQIELKGAQYVFEVSLDERNGDNTRIRFSELSTLPAPSIEEQRRLAD